MILMSNSNIYLLKEIFGKFLSFIPNIISALVIIIAGIVIAKIIYKFLSRLLRKAGIDKLSDNLNRIDFIDKLNLNIKLSNIIAKFVYYFIILIMLIIATDILKMPVVSNLIVDIFNFIPNLLVALILLVLGLLLASWLKKMVFTIAKSLGLPSASLISNLVFYFIFVNVLISAMVQAKINIEFFSTNITLIIAGVVFAFALAYGLASKSILANIISSFYYKNKYKIGDYIKIGENEGKICEIDNFHIILCKEDTKIVIPLNILNETEVKIISKNKNS